MVYGPRQDSYFLKEYVESRNLEGKKVLEIGTGSGLIALAAARKAAEVVAVDRNPEAVKQARENAEAENIENIGFQISDMFDNLEGSFDLIVFNPPYLPGERRSEEDPLVGGEKGTELVEKFFKEADSYLNDGGEAVSVASSLSEIDELKQKFDVEEIKSEKLWFETLYLLRAVS